MGNLIMPKHSGLVSEFKAALKVCYDRRAVNDGWIPTGHAKQGIDGFTLYLYQEYHHNKAAGHHSPKNDNSDYTKDAQLPLYFGFMEITGNRADAQRRITPSGIEMYEAMLSDDKEKIYSLFVNALESTTFGRNNSACENSNSDLEAPNILILSSIALNGIKRKEFYYILWQLEEKGGELSNALSTIQVYRNQGIDVPNVDNTYTDAKFIPFWTSIGFLTEKIENKLHVSDEVKAKYISKLIALRAKNSEVFMGPVRIIKNTTAAQVIYYGCPGTGKSFIVKEKSEGEDGTDIIWYQKPTDEDKSCKKFEGIPTDEEKKNHTNNIFRTTFHPDYDYATFVGCYKPVKEGAAIDYKFIPQVFTNAYVCAYRHREDPIYLIIEEINRGNCAQIFGDLFQLLDRTNGESDYAIKPDTELAKYLAGQGVPSDELKLPDNLHIYATMNTSDQSLFPMDSAFKRRWAMEYMPINYTQKKASTFTIEVAGKKYPWIKFLEMVNERIVNATDSEDKQMGEFFIKESIKEREFINKVMFYLWNDVCKDLYNPRHVQGAFFLRVKNKLETEKNDYFTFAELFSDRNENSRLLIEFFAYLESKYQEVKPEFTFKPIEEPAENE